MEIVWRRAALNDLEAIREFIAQVDPGAAARVGNAIRAAVDPLAGHPNLRRVGRVEGSRELIVSNAPYIVAYRVVEDGLASWPSSTHHASGRGASDRRLPPMLSCPSYRSVAFWVT
jgi:plasmid stabilization system protein ParE